MTYSEAKRSAEYLLNNIKVLLNETGMLGSGILTAKLTFDDILNFHKSCTSCAYQYDLSLSHVYNVKRYGNLVAKYKYNYEQAEFLDVKDKIHYHSEGTKAKSTFDDEVEQLTFQLSCVRPIDKTFSSNMGTSIFSVLNVNFDDLDAISKNLDELEDRVLSMMSASNNRDYSKYVYIADSPEYQRYMPPFNVNYKSVGSIVISNFRIYLKMVEKYKNAFKKFKEMLENYEDGKTVEFDIRDYLDEGNHEEEYEEYQPEQIQYMPVNEYVKIKSPKQIVDWDKIDAGFTTKEQVKEWAKNFPWGKYGYSYTKVQTSNCFTYAKYRSAALTGKSITGSYGSAKGFRTYAKSSSKFNTSNTPSIGAIVIFTGAGYNTTYGHAAVVEQINDDGSIMVSESNYSHDFNLRKVTVSEYQSSSVTFITVE